jgi:hypothetical protein
MFALKTVCRASLVAAALLMISLTAQAQIARPKTFSSPEEAVTALVTAAKDKDQGAVLDILGRSYRSWIISGDQVLDLKQMQKFADAYAQKSSLTAVNDRERKLTVGNDDFPFPFPIVERRGRWSFDPEAGKEELLNRRIGQNELDTIEVLRAVVDAEREYALQDPDNNGAPDYAMKFISSPGKRDGLYWPTLEGTPESPLGPLVGEARQEGYGNRDTRRDRPYKGYYYRLLMRQGRNAEGGAYDYVIRGKMIGGFAVVAFPARYGISGIKTFMVNQDGVVYEADLGRSTALSATKMDKFDPDKRWTAVKAE